MANGTQESVRNFVFIAFLLLAALFGMIIMTFIFGNLGPENSGLPTGNEAFNISQQVQNNSLVAIRTYSTQANTQFTTVAIAITLAVLIAVFLLFWRAFMGSTMGGGKRGAGSGSFA